MVRPTPASFPFAVAIAGAAILPLALMSVSTIATPQDPPAIQPVPFHAVRVDDAFWSPRMQRNRTVAIPHSFQQSHQTQRVANFLVAAKQRAGGMTGYFFNDSDVYKLLEGAAHALRTERDPDLEKRCDEVIDAIAAAQEPDGYLYTSRTILDPKHMPPGGVERWSNIDHGHELYNVGHLYEAAVAYQEATGKTTLYDVAVKNADLVLATFGRGKNPFPPGHPEIELGLLRLWQHTGEQRYLDQARWFVDARGVPTKGRHLFGEYSQDHEPVVEQDAIVGHAVRAAYLFAATTDLARFTGDGRYLAASVRLWEDMASTQVYLTGGIGSQGSNEGFGSRFTLPNQSGYGETCASIANAMWSHRLFLATGKSHYLDMVERVIFNAFHSGWSLGGDRFFYPNPLSSRGAERQAWFACACCPPNVNRFVPQIGGLVLATAKGSIFVNPLLACEATLQVDGRKVGLKVATDYPWNSTIRVSVATAEPANFAVRIRLPGWARSEPLPGGLYRFGDRETGSRQLTVNGESFLGRNDDGFAVVERQWRDGDQVEYKIPMPVRRVLCDDRVSSNRGLVALQRGPLVYCFEGLDQPNAEVQSFVLADDATFTTEHRPDLLGGVTVVQTTVRAAFRTLEGGVAVGEPFTATAIPYFAWANRGRTPMTVWVARTPERAEPSPAPTLARRSAATSSFTDKLDALSDQREPAASLDPDDRHVHWWPRKGTAQWLQYAFPEAARVSGVEVYWFDDTGRGECKVPASWQVLARIDGEWRAVAEPSGFPCDKDRWCRATFRPVEADGLRLEVQSQEGWAGGVYEWRVLTGR